MKSIKPHDLNPLVEEDQKIFKSLSPGSLYHLFPIIASSKPLKGSGGYSASSVFEYLNNRDTVDYVNGTVKTDTIKAYIFMLHSMTTSTYLKPSQGKCTELSCAVPLALYAFKHQYDIKYMEWDHEDPLFARLVPKGLDWAIRAELPKYSIDEVRELRNRVLLERSSGTLKPLTAYKMEKSNDPQFDALPKLARFLLLQTWIYNPALRSPNMVTDVENWDNVAPAIDSVTSLQVDLKEKEAKATKSLSVDDLPW